MVKFVKKQIGDIVEKAELKFLKTNFNKFNDLSKKKTSEFSLPLVNAKHGNNGIMYYGRLTDFDHITNSIDIVEDGAVSAGDVYYQEQNTGVLYNAYLVRPKSIKYRNNKELVIYLATAISKVLKTKYGYENKATWNKVKNELIQVPVTADDKLDTKYMAYYVQKIEASYVQKIEAYLAVLGYKSLADCQLNQHDLDVLHAKPKMEKIKVNSLFSISKLKGLNKNDLNINSKGKYPYITRTAQNNGVESYTDFVDNDHLQPAGTFSLGLMQMSLFYQSKPWYNGQFVRKITPTKNYNSKELMFLQTHLQKLTKLFDPQAIRKVDDVFNKASFTLPVTSSGTPDWQFMEDYITAIEKLKVLKIKQFLDTKINAYQNIIK